MVDYKELLKEKHSKMMKQGEEAELTGADVLLGGLPALALRQHQKNKKGFYCPQCGKKVNKRFKYCPECGKKL